MAKAKNKEKKPQKKGISAKEAVVGLIIIALAVWGVYSLSQPSQTGTTRTVVSSVTSASGAPDFTLPVVGPNGLTGQTASLSSYRGKVVLLEFMVPWCPHCQHMAPVLAQLYAQYGAQNVVFLSVSGSWAEGPGSPPASASDAAAFIRNYGTSWTVVYDSSGTVFSNYGVNSTPTFFLLDKNGVVARTYQGEVASSTLAADIAQLNP